MVENPQIEITKNKFKEFSKSYNLIPVYKVINKDNHTPVSIYKSLKNYANTFLLESVEGNKNFARYSFIGLNPDKICLLYTSPSPRDGLLSRMPSSA